MTLNPEMVKLEFMAGATAHDDTARIIGRSEDRWPIVQYVREARIVRLEVISGVLDFSLAAFINVSGTGGPVRVEANTVDRLFETIDRVFAAPAHRKTMGLS